MSRLGIRRGLGLVEHVGGGCCTGDVGESRQLGAEEWGFATAGDNHRSLVGHGRDDGMVAVCPGDPIGFEGYSVEHVEGTESSQLVGVEVGCIGGAEGDLRCGRRVNQHAPLRSELTGAAYS